MYKNVINPILVLLVLLSAACGGEETVIPVTGEPESIMLNSEMNPGNGFTADDILNTVIDPDNFVDYVDNPYFPLRPGETYHYESTSQERNETETAFITSTVTCENKWILGVSTTVVHVVEADEEGEVCEDTFDWYAQDIWGNVWYFGEFTIAYENGESSTEGSWEAGVDGAKPGIIMWAHPRDHVGEIYYQEYYAGVAEDQAKVLPNERTVKVPYGIFHRTVNTEDFTALESDILERKTYVRDIGAVRAIMVRGGKELEELVDITFEPCD